MNNVINLPVRPLSLADRFPGFGGQRVEEFLDRWEMLSFDSTDSLNKCTEILVSDIPTGTIEREPFSQETLGGLSRRR